MGYDAIGFPTCIDEGNLRGVGLGGGSRKGLYPRVMDESAT